MPEQDQTEFFQFSQSVKAYFGDKAVRSAVDLLVAKGFVFAPSNDDEWSQIDTFYDACLAAQQTQIEFAKDLARLWEVVWGARPGDLEPIASDPASQALTLSPDVRWEEQYFERHFHLPHAKTVWLWVVLGDEPNELTKVEMAFDVREKNRSLVRRRKDEILNQLSGWRFEHDAVRLTCENTSAVALDLTTFCTEAARAVQVIKQFEW